MGRTLAPCRSLEPNASQAEGTPNPSLLQQGGKEKGWGGPRVPVPNTLVAFASLSLLRVIPKFFLTAVYSAPFAPGLIDVWWEWVETDSHSPPFLEFGIFASVFSFIWFTYKICKCNCLLLEFIFFLASD